MPEAMIAGGLADADRAEQLPRAPVVPADAQAPPPPTPRPLVARSPPALARPGPRARTATAAGEGRDTPGRSSDAGAPVGSGQPAPLTAANCVGRVVLCPAKLWPKTACKEHGGAGWEARVMTTRDSSDGCEVQIQLTTGPSRKRPYEPLWIALSELRPL